MKKTNTDLPNSKLRITNQRRVILDEFRKPNLHFTADEVYRKVRRKLPRISLGTIYRNLEILSEHGLIRKLELTGHQKIFDGNLNDHYHVRCIKCDRLEDIPMESIAIDIRKIKKKHKFKIVGHRLELLGLCPQCRQKSRTTK